MKPNLLVTILVSLVCLAACKKTTVDSLENRITGNWLVVGSNSLYDNNGITVEWGIYYLNKLGLTKEHQFTVNGGTIPIGSWQLKDNDQKIIFYTEYNDAGIIHRDTTQFNISINNDILIFSDNVQTIIHKRIK